MNHSKSESILPTENCGDVILVSPGASTKRTRRFTELIDAFGDCLDTERLEYSLDSDWNPSLIIQTLPNASQRISIGSAISFGMLNIERPPVGTDGSEKTEVKESQDISLPPRRRGVLSRAFLSFVGFMKSSGESILEAVQWTGKVIYVLCPPIPSMMVQKVSFQPPPKGKFYFLLPSSEVIPNVRPRKRLIKLEAYDTSFQSLSFVFPYLGRNSEDPDYPTSREQIQRLRAHVLVSTSGNYLVGAEIRCMRSLTIGKKSPKILLFAQPNSSDIGACMMTDPNLVDISDFLNCDMFAFDYSGFGMSNGSPTETNVYNDIESVFLFIQTTLGYAPEDIIPLGFSMGTASSIHLAATFREITAMVLIAPFTSVLRVIARSPTIERTPQIDKFRSVDKIGRVEARTLVCHGRKDFIVPINHGELIYTKLKNASEPLWVTEASHQGIYCDKTLWNRVGDFLNEEIKLDSLWNELECP